MTTSTAATQPLRIGTAPDSWGVWFADHPRQTAEEISAYMLAAEVSA